MPEPAPRSPSPGPWRWVAAAERADNARRPRGIPAASAASSRPETPSPSSCDLNSTNGTFVNDQPIYGRRQIEPGRPHPGGHDRDRAAQRRAGARPAIGSHPRAEHGHSRRRHAAAGAARPAAIPGAALVRPSRCRPPPAAGPDQADPGYAAVAALVDSRVKRQTNVAVFALLSAAGLAVLIFFGVR